VIFANVKLQEGDDSVRLRSLGMPLSGMRQPRLSQPCAALDDGCRCRIYSERPRYCREFECLLLKKVNTGEIEKAAALRKIQMARRCAARVSKLLGLLGDDREQVALNERFKKTVKRLEQTPLDDKTVRVYGELTLAVHELNVVLSQHFYPGML
jgi:Fe-S-cluster containining protein